MDLGLAFGFWGVSALLCLTPGADWAYIMASALKNRSPMPAVGGLLSGHVLAVVVVAAGVGTIVAEMPWTLTALTVAGAFYLIWLGVGMFRTPPVPRQGELIAGDTVVQQVIRGFCVSGLNPKLYLLVLVILPQFVDPVQPLPLGFQMSVIGVVHLINCTLIYILVGYGARIVLRARPTAARAVSCLSGIAMTSIGAFLLLEQVAGR